MFETMLYVKRMNTDSGGNRCLPEKALSPRPIVCYHIHILIPCILKRFADIIGLTDNFSLEDGVALDGLLLSKDKWLCLPMTRFT